MLLVAPDCHVGGRLIGSALIIGPNWVGGVIACIVVSVTILLTTCNSTAVPSGNSTILANLWLPELLAKCLPAWQLISTQRSSLDTVSRDQITEASGAPNKARQVAALDWCIQVIESEALLLHCLFVCTTNSEFLKTQWSSDRNAGQSWPGSRSCLHYLFDPVFGIRSHILDNLEGQREPR